MGPNTQIWMVDHSSISNTSKVPLPKLTALMLHLIGDVQKNSENSVPL
jgi:hypothetical protein